MIIINYWKIALHRSLRLIGDSINSIDFPINLAEATVARACSRGEANPKSCGIQELGEAGHVQWEESLKFGDQTMLVQCIELRGFLAIIIIIISSIIIELIELV